MRFMPQESPQFAYCDGLSPAYIRGTPGRQALKIGPERLVQRLRGDKLHG
jgi:hypothetical protein